MPCVALVTESNRLLVAAAGNSLLVALSDCDDYATAVRICSVLQLARIFPAWTNIADWSSCEPRLRYSLALYSPSDLLIPLAAFDNRI